MGSCYSQNNTNEYINELENEIKKLQYEIALLSDEHTNYGITDNVNYTIHHDLP